MSSEICVGPDVEDLLSNIITKNKLSDKCTTTYAAGSDTGDGYLSKSYAVSIKDENQSLELFIKCGLKLKETESFPVNKYYANETHFYEVVYPTYAKFLKEKNVRDGFRNVAKCYGTSPKNIIALENLKKKGYTMCNKKQPLNNQHIECVLRTFAKFHAISFAYKDQRKDDYERLIAPTQNIHDNMGNDAMEDAAKQKINEFLSTLDPVLDKHILDGTDNLGEILMEAGKNAFKNVDDPEYSILTQGDCWCNNILFLYENNNRENTIDVILVDWQIIRTCLPVNDIAYFFYTVASEEAMKNYKHYLEVYYEELSEQMRKLGSDPEVLYPFSLLERHWKRHAKFGFYMAFILIRIMLSEKDETMNLETIDFESGSSDGLFFEIRDTNEYNRRIKLIAEHMVINEFL